MSKGKILILANDTNYTYNLRDVLIEQFVAAGYEVALASNCLGFQDELRAMGCRLIELKIDRHSKNPLSDLSLLHMYRSILRRERPDVVLSFNIKPNIYGGIACMREKLLFIPNITGLGIAVENRGVLRTVSTALYRLAMSRADCVMFQNEGNRQFFLDHKLLKKGAHTCLLPGSGVNLKKFQLLPYPLEDSTPTFSVIGRIMQAKGTDELIEAAREVRKHCPGVCFRVIGAFDDNYQELIVRAEREGLIEYLPQQKNIRPFIAESWAVIQPSHHEGMSNVLLESAASGRPVIASDIPGCRETFDDGVSGFGFPVGDAEALSATILRFIALPYSEKCAMGLAGRGKMEQSFGRNLVAQKYLQIIEKALGK